MNLMTQRYDFYTYINNLLNSYGVFADVDNTNVLNLLSLPESIRSPMVKAMTRAGCTGCSIRYKWTDTSRDNIKTTHDPK